jgi:xanthine dehydrogenase accessory factor
MQTSGDLAVITIITKKGSTPRLPGTRMLVTADGKTWGTVGGGFCEADAVRAAAEVITTHKNRILQYSSVPGSSFPDDIICGGSLDVLVEYLPADRYHLQVISEFVEHQKKRTTPVMIIPLPDTGRNDRIRFFIDADGLARGFYGDLPVQQLQGIVNTFPYPEILVINGERFLVEPCPPHCRLIICGAGYISAEITPLACHLGFEVQVLDDRYEFLEQDVFSGVTRVSVMSYETCLQTREVDVATGILIVTRSHLFDLQVLRQALLTPAWYIGMIGSNHKWRAISSVLLDEGFCESDLARVCCPVGLDIGADSPEEIAISIAAELIRFRSERKNQQIKMMRDIDPGTG